MITYTPNTFKKIELLFKDLGYQVRSGKGGFNTGYCLLEKKKIVVLNSFHSIDARINGLIDVLQLLEVDATHLTEEHQKLYKQLMGKKTTDE